MWIPDADDDGFSFRSTVEGTLHRLEQRTPQHPHVVEFGLLGVIAAWEGTVTGITHPQEWRRIWQRRCRMLHPNRIGRTLGDIPSPEDDCGPEQASAIEEQETGMRQVRQGMSRLHARLMDNGERDVVKENGDLVVLDRLIAESLEPREWYPDPGSWEAYLYALMAMRERLVPQPLRMDVFWLWRDEVHRIERSPTRMLADTVPGREVQERFDKASKEGAAGLLASYGQIRREMTALIEEMKLP